MLTRSYNPVWLFDDLVGHILDDTYYLYTLSNTIPYLPIPIYKDSDGNVPWDDPLQFNANGTLPINMYFDPDTVYRLEIRNGNTQDATLVYLVENYIPVGSGGVGPVTTNNVSIVNQITNPQFAVVNFTGAYTSTAATISNIAPGWDIVCTGDSGSITVTQIPVIGTSSDTSNPSYALKIQSSGWSFVSIRQTFEGNGALWSSDTADSGKQGVSLSISAYHVSGAGTAPPLTGFITYSGSSTVNTDVFSSVLINDSPNQYSGAAFMPPSVNTALPATASTSVSFQWTSNNTVILTSVQLIGQRGDNLFQIPYQESTLERQVDQTYHYYANSLVLQPKSSVLTGWKFSLNPWQFTTTDSTNVATNTYTADQTIIVQQDYVAAAAGNRVAVGQASAADNYGFKITAAATLNQFATVQYIDAATIRGYWGYKMSALLRLKFKNNNATIGLQVKMRLIYNTSIPNTTSQTYPIASWSALGEPVFASGFTAIVPLNDPAYDISTTSSFTSFPFEAFTLPANTASTQTLGIVVYTTKSMSASGTADYIVIDDVSLVANDFAIASNILTNDEALRRCQYYYESTYSFGVLPGTASSSDGQLVKALQFYYSSSNTLIIAAPFDLTYSLKRTNAPVITLYNPADGTMSNVQAVSWAGALVTATGYPSSNWTQFTLNSKAASYVPNVASTIITNAGVGAETPFIELHATIDGRIG